MCSVPPNCSVTPGNVNQSLGCPALIDTAPGWINNSPCGMTLNREMVKADNLGTTFSQNAWAAAQEEGCLGCPNRYPSWPEPAVRPQLDIPFQAAVGTDPNFAVNDSPYVEPLSFYPNNYPSSPNNPRGVPGNNPPVVMARNPGTILPNWPQESQDHAQAQAQPNAQNNAPQISHQAQTNAPQIFHQPQTNAPQISHQAQANAPHISQQSLSQQPHQQPSFIQAASPAPNLITSQVREVHKKDTNSFVLFFQHIGNAIRGIIYDLAHWNSKHPDVPTDFFPHLKWVFTRDDRLYRLFYLLSMAVLLTILIWYALFHQTEVQYVKRSELPGKETGPVPFRYSQSAFPTPSGE